MMKGYFLAITIVISLNSLSEESSNFSEKRKIEYIKDQISLILPAALSLSLIICFINSVLILLPLTSLICPKVGPIQAANQLL